MDKSPVNNPNQLTQGDCVTVRDYVSLNTILY